MANRTEHAFVGVLAGAVYAALWSTQRAQTDELGRFAEFLGGVFGGYVGGVLPDQLEPATSPKHRQMMHSFLVLVGVAGTSLVTARAHCRAQAHTYRQRRLAKLLGGVVSNEDWLGEFVWSFLAGFTSGVQAGYVSHLLLDARTPASLPLIGIRV